MAYIKPIREVYKQQRQEYLKKLKIKQKQTKPLNMNTLSKAQYYNSKTWKALRQKKITDQPLCEVCLQRGITKPASDIHHAIKFYDQFTEELKALLFSDYDNLISVCEDCHHCLHGNKKTKLLWPEQRAYIDNIKNTVSQKYLDQGIIIRWTEDSNKKKYR